MSKASPKAIWHRRGLVMVPANDDAFSMIASLQDGGEYLADFRGARSLKQLRLYWGLMKLLVEHDLFPTRDAASDCVKIACGHVETRIMPDSGEVQLVPRSIAFQSLPQAEFNEIFEAMIKVICDRWLAGVDESTLRDEAYAMIDGPAAQGRRG